ncbi:GGDEF domain-containing protein [Roseateles sp. BYS180W]|uniref:diguanylate cyclase n=1 Tax=Roseateles rivi TaxID=3299028 RepID=A0ABW7FZ88_9BURK
MPWTEGGSLNGIVHMDSVLDSLVTGVDDWLTSLGAGQPAAAVALASLLEASGAAVSLKSLADGRYEFASRHWCQMFEIDGAAIGLDDVHIFSADDALMLRRAEQTCLARGGRTSNEHRMDWRGRRREWQVWRVPCGSDRVLSLWLELTESRRREDTLQRALQQVEAQHRQLEEMRRDAQVGTGRDALTGLYLRPHFEDQLLREIDLSQREHREFALVLLSLGVGAQSSPGAVECLMEALGRTLRTNTRAMDLACRVGERHFAVLFSGVGLATAHARMEQLRRQFEQLLVVHEGKELRADLAIGVASFPHTTSDRATLLAASDAALAEAQRRGGSHVVLAPIAFEPGRWRDSGSGAEG